MNTFPFSRALNDCVWRLQKLRWKDAALILLGIFALANWQLLTGRAIEKWDAYDLATPAYSLMSDFIRAGRFVYWNPWLAGGSPDFAVAGSGTFSPDLLLFAALTGPGGTGYLTFWLAVWLAGGLGMLLLARHLNAPVWGGLVVSLGFTFSGFYAGHAEHVSVLYSYSLLPFIIWRLDLALTEQRFIPALQAGALWGLTGLAGYPAFTIYTVGVIVAWTTGRSFLDTQKAPRASWRHALLVLVAVGSVGVAVLSPSYISAAYEGRGYSDRSGPVTREFALNSNALHPAALVTLGSPAYPEMKLAQKNLWSYTDVSCLSLYTAAQPSSSRLLRSAAEPIGVGDGFSSPPQLPRWLARCRAFSRCAAGSTTSFRPLATSATPECSGDISSSC